MGTLFSMLSAFIVLPLWLLLVMNKQYLPDFLKFLGPKESAAIPCFFATHCEVVLFFILIITNISKNINTNSAAFLIDYIGGAFL
jgi:stage V sporulation protein AF